MEKLTPAEAGHITLDFVGKPRISGGNIYVSIAIANRTEHMLSSSGENPLHLVTFFATSPESHHRDWPRSKVQIQIDPGESSTYDLSIPVDRGRLIATLVQEDVMWLNSAAGVAAVAPLPTLGLWSAGPTLVARAGRIVIQQIVRSKTAARWKRWNHSYRLPTRLDCPICLYSGGDFKIHRAEDAFGGGLLLRFECPRCGVIFGTEKMLSLSKKQLAREYRELYAVYDEGDTTETELAAFEALNPTKSGKYLNYGCGRWSQAIGILRQRGFDVMGYDPTAGRAKSDFVISRENALRKMRFSGLMSHNLLEHLQDPVATLLFMRSLLMEGAVMVHATPCYRYEYEDSRFHLFFFTGDSVNIMAHRAGLRANDTTNPNVKIFAQFSE